MGDITEKCGIYFATFSAPPNLEQFLNTSLSKLSQTLCKSDMKIVRENCINNTEFELVTQKGVFPYDYLDNWDKFEDTTLPKYEDFYSELSLCNITLEEYEHAKKVWKIFNIKNLGEYSDLYLKTDVLLLADIFQTFRMNCLSSYGLDPAYYFTLPSFTWDAMLKFTNIKLELLTDVDKVMFIERGIRGGISQCCKRHSVANNKYMHDLYDPMKDDVYLMYFDVNNLYGWAMSQALPYAEFKLVDNCENFDVNNIDTNSTLAYILEIDLNYPQSIHNSHIDLPFCPTHDLSPVNSKHMKLLTTLYDKKRYVIHIRMLRKFLKHGLQLDKIHRILQFKQKEWLRIYIELNTELRVKANNDFEKNLYKLMNNAVFGKTMENVRNHVDVKLCTVWDGRYGANSYISKPNFHSRVIFNENLMAIKMNKLCVTSNKPIYVGMSILDISKICLYDFHYNYMKTSFNDCAKILYMDTDSLINEIKHFDIYETIKRDCRTMLDTSDYSTNNIYKIPLVNKKVSGLMKDENNGYIMKEFIGLRSKINITIQDYFDCLFNQDIKVSLQGRINSKLHKVYSILEEKIALNPYDDKRFIMDDFINTLPWGHFKTNEKKKCKDRK
ncbi:uncharacterized protein [Prorops nasuta]|uniref:uncharacterized protein n=1 Tax=Prorops nasuta TaxID=863751 RepID=UPI0034CE8A58